MRPKSVRRLRRQLGWSQHMLASRAGLLRSKLSLYENGFAELTAAELQRVLDALMLGLKVAEESASKELAELATAK